MFGNLLTYNLSNINYEMVYDLAAMSRNVYYNLNDNRWMNVSLPQVFDISINNDTVKSYLFTTEVEWDFLLFKLRHFLLQDSACLFANLPARLK